ncbi:hypothetical protein, partial [Pseudomonas sp. NY15354]|uniref:hypothetical protein n=1 Tax=Pseudomonas sp. NY15354 TaxID=3400351 RepID=UPI003A86CDDB
DRFDLEFFGVTLTTHGTSYLGLIMRLGGVYETRGDSMWAGGFRHIEPPFEILHHTRSQGSFSDYNEVLVVTRPCAKIHFSMTKEVKVTGILYSPSNRGADPTDDITLLHALLALNPELDIELA